MYNTQPNQPNCPSDCRKKLDECKVMFRKIIIPAVLGDDSPTSEVAPHNGDYCDAMVVYEANNHIYFYTSDGIYTRLESESAKVKLYSTTGTHEDGAMTQLATTQALNEKQDELTAGPGIIIIDDPYTRRTLISAPTSTVDDALSTTSENPVQNKVITNALMDKADQSELANYATKTELADGLATKADQSELGNYATVADMNAGLAGKQDALTMGDGLDLTGDTLSLAIEPVPATEISTMLTEVFGS